MNLDCYSPRCSNGIAFKFMIMNDFLLLLLKKSIMVLTGILYGSIYFLLNAGFNVYNKLIYQILVSIEIIRPTN